MRFIFLKLLYVLGVLVGVASLVFFLFQGFGDPARLVSGQSGDKQTLANIRKQLHLDQPKWKQLFYYLNDVSPIGVHEDGEIAEKKLKGIFFGGHTKIGIKFPYLGKSYQRKQYVQQILADALPGTVVLATASLLLAIFFGILMGTIAALYKGRWPDHLATAGSIAGTSFPSFFVAIVLAYFFGMVWHEYTGLSPMGSLYEVNEVTGKKTLALQHLWLPAITLGIRPLAIIAQLTRSSLIDVMKQDYIRTAYAKGLKQSSVIWAHALRNAINPVLTAITGWFAEMLAGSFFIEYIFGWNGLGKITVDAIEKLDYPVVMGAVLLSACLFIAVNVLSDLLYRYADPRIR